MKSFSYENKVHLLNGVWAFLLIQSIVVPFFNSNGLSITEIFIIQLVHSTILLLFDIPTSYLADKWGKKKLLLFATIFRGIGGYMFHVSSDFHSFILTYIIIGVGNSIFSGVGIAILYDNNQNISDNPLLKNYNITRLFSIFGLIIGSFIGTYSLKLVSFLNMITACLPFFVVLTIKRPVFLTQQKKIKILEIISYFKSQDMKFFKLFIFSSLYTSLIVINVYFGQIVFGLFSKKYLMYGIILAFSQILTIFFSKNLHLGQIQYEKILILIWAILPLIYIFFSMGSIVFFGFAIFLAETVRWLVQAILINSINRTLLLEYRATLNSMIGFGSILIMFFIGPLIGKLSILYTIKNTSVFLSCIVFLIPILIYILFIIIERRFHAKKRNYICRRSEISIFERNQNF